MAIVCAGAMVPTKIITGLSPVVTAPEFLKENVEESEETVEHAFEGMPKPRHDWNRVQRDVQRGVFTAISQQRVVY